MTHTIDDIDHYWGTETLHLPFNVENPDGSAKDLTGATIEWELQDRNDQVVLSDSDSGVSTTIGTSGTFRVEIDADVTSGLGDSVYDERTTVIDDAGNKSIVGANFSITQP